MEDDTLTIEKLREMKALLDCFKPDPLAGLQSIYYAKNMADEARKIADLCYAGAAFGAVMQSRPLTLPSGHLPLGYMVGVNGKGEVVLLGGPPVEPKPEPPIHPWSIIAQMAVS